MAGKNFIVSMKSYDIELLCTQVAWMLEKRTELASRTKLPGLWKLTDKLNATPRAPEAELKRRAERRRRFGGLFLVMGIFLFVPGVMKSQELLVPLVTGFFAMILGMLYLRKGDRKKNSYEKKARKLLENLNAAARGQKQRLVFEETELVFSGTGEESRVAYANVECVLETSDLFGVIYEKRIVLLQKKELLLGESGQLEKSFREKMQILVEMEK